MAQVVINGQTYEIPDGATVSVNAYGKVIVNGAEYSAEEGSTKIEVRVLGAVGKVTAERGSIIVHGEVGEVVAGGSVDCGRVKGNIQAGGSVKASSVGGSIQSGGSVRIG